MSVTTNVPRGNHHRMGRGKKAPAQKARAYKALKLGGNNPGQRDRAATSMNRYGRHLVPFPFTISASGSRWRVTSDGGRVTWAGTREPERCRFCHLPLVTCHL